MNMYFRQLGLISCKNYVLRKRYWKSSIIEALFPVLFIVLVVVLLGNISSIEPVYLNVPTTHQPVDISENHTCSSYHLLFSPENEFSKKIILNLGEDFVSIVSKSCSNEEEMEKELIALKNEYTPNLFGIVFEGSPENLNSLGDFKYKIRPNDYYWNTDGLFPDFPGPGPMYASDYYISHCFIKLQLALDKAFIRLSVNDLSTSKLDYKFYLQKFPYPPYFKIEAIDFVFKYILPVCVMISFFINLIILVKRIMEEKMSGAKELMSMMGMGKGMQWLGWFVTTLSIMFLDVVIIIIIFQVGYNGNPVTRYSNGFLVFIFLLVYILASISSMFVVCAFCPRESIGVFVALLLMFASGGLTFFLRSKSVCLFGKILLSLLPNAALVYGFEIIGLYEGGTVGLQWKNLWQNHGGRVDELSMGGIIAMLLVSNLVYASIVYYFDGVFPGKFGVAKPWYFPFKRVMVKLHSILSSKNEYIGGDNERLAFNEMQRQMYDSNEKLAFEALPPGKSPGIQIRGVRKVYGSLFTCLGEGVMKVAVDDVSLDLLEGEITALLGHNGAGKTTLISILTGISSSSEGRVLVNGYDIKKKMDKIRESLGLCPQHSMLFPDLTVWEHLMFFSMSKGLTYQASKVETDHLIKQLALEPKRNDLAKNLSGGMKRKLSVGMALAGKSKILILDEPTAGMDPESRRHLWDLLLSMRGDHTILITTHNMEEADILGDRIAIMVHGQVKCYGTSLFLKNIYGAGYHLSLLFSDKTANRNDSTLKITNMIEENVPGSTVRNQSGDGISYTLPSSATSHFPKLFQLLDEEGKDLGISGMSLSVTTLEEVFLEVGKLTEGDLTDGKLNGRSPVDDMIENTSENVDAKVCGIHLYNQQAKALLIKKALFMKSKWILFLMQAIVGILLLILALHGTDPTSHEYNEPALTFSIQDYRNSNAFVSEKGAVGLQAENVYVQLLNSKGTNVTRVEWGGITDALLDAAVVDEGGYRENYIASAAFGEKEITILYSTTLMHSCPTSLNLVTTTLLRLLTNSTDRSIIATNHPFPYLNLAPSFNMSDVNTAMAIWFLFGLQGFSMICAFFTMLPTLEGASGARHLQLMAMKSFSILFWIVPFLFDIAIFMLVICAALLFFPITAGGSWIFAADFYGSLLLLSLLIAACEIPFAYLISYFKKTTGSAFMFFVTFGIIFGSIFGIITFVMEMFLNDSHVHIGVVLHSVGMVIPFFNGAYGLAKIAHVAVHNMKCSSIPAHLKKSLCEVAALQDMNFDISCCENLCKDFSNCHEHVSYLGWGNFSMKHSFTNLKPEGIGIELFALALLSLFYFGLLYLIDLGIFPNALEKLIEFLSQCFRKNIVETDGRGDDDVLRENERVDYAVRNIKKNGVDTLLVHNLKKNYGLFRWLWKGNSAVKGVSFGVRSGECFGLLGANGAGKTSTFEMITGSLPTSSNSSYVLGEKSGNWSGINKKYVTSIGYCPQFNATLGSLTGRQMLKLFACLRGIPYENADRTVQIWLNNLGLNEPADRNTSAYSGGNHRRLCTAIALMGDLPLVCLDEPTAGVDPVARRQLWAVLTSACSGGMALVLTSHSMEECEALCTKLAIMVNGEFLCIGTIPYLKHKYGQGFTLLVKLNVQMNFSDTDNPQVSTVKEKIESSFNPCTLKDEHEGLLHYHITNPETKWAYMFTVMEELQRNMHPLIEDYSISDTTLEQVFLSFVREQKKVSESAEEDI
ncbi:phospholipid-transporting ATPase ABCA3 [Hetaerina americana]|uniref:phospholipid-transporting ATPase ABCA3 n=1 Tax=Hetaerina americana TaxID=62018 RepID=UPI003A7F40E4